MIEILLVYSILLNVELITAKEYNEYLDTLFLDNETDDLLLELEFFASNRVKSLQLIQQHIDNNNISFDYDKFGQILFQKLEHILYEEKLDIHKFGVKGYKIWQMLPESIRNKEPFFTLSYADDCLAWGDEKQTRELYQKAFVYFQKNSLGEWI